LHAYETWCFLEIVYRFVSKSLCWNMGMVSAKHEVDKQDFSNVTIEILDIAFSVRIRELLHSRQLDR